MLVQRGFGVVSANQYFDDVPPSHAWFDAVQWVKDQGISNGCETGKFCLERPATRGEVAVFLYRALGPGATGSGSNATTPNPQDESGGGISIFGKPVSPYLLGGGLLLLLALVRR